MTVCNRLLQRPSSRGVPQLNKGPRALQHCVHSVQTNPAKPNRATPPAPTNLPRFGSIPRNLVPTLPPPTFCGLCTLPRVMFLCLTEQSTGRTTSHPAPSAAHLGPSKPHVTTREAAVCSMMRARARLQHQSNLCGGSSRTMRVAAAAASPPEARHKTKVGAAQAYTVHS